MLAGTGKTFTIFYVAWDYTNNSKEVVIVVPNDLLRRQMIPKPQNPKFFLN